MAEAEQHSSASQTTNSTGEKSERANKRQPITSIHTGRESAIKGRESSGVLNTL